ncbi:uncharacterized protein LOC123890768 [Trifolium pratense]|uniref:Uncharacterized protein n=1 Tax=Trifolium pratense TaxID=57577 RepID=A0ACB0IM70_TRIPR|nr:uncharacterized protein LOC123890768 [Trifolium pratense]CAJ2633265.1 unnamed protein product [Trifolium pratense]
MEVQKHRALVHFLKRCNKRIEFLFQCMDQILRVNDPEISVVDYDENDIVLPYVKRDMLMLVNQIPMKVLHILTKVETEVDEEDDYELNKKIIKLLNPIFMEDTSSNEKIKELGKCMRVLDLYRKSLILEEPSYAPPPPKPQKTKENCLCLEAGNEITSFIFLMDTIVDSAMDVPILSRSGILINALGNDKVVAKLFNSMSKEIPVERGGHLVIVRNSMNLYCKKPWKNWRACLIHAYFRNPWAIVSLVAAIFLFALTIIQTIYTVRQFDQNPSPSPSPTKSPSFPVTPRPHRRP